MRRSRSTKMAHKYLSDARRAHLSNRECLGDLRTFQCARGHIIFTRVKPNQCPYCHSAIVSDLTEDIRRKPPGRPKWTDLDYPARRKPRKKKRRNARRD